jgi:hemoglobin
MEGNPHPDRPFVLRMSSEPLAPGPSLYERLGGHEGILRLITPFYTAVRQHSVLGPIFNERIADWTAHLAKITEFWAGMTGGPSGYMGGMGRHLSLPVGGEHFQAWLALWDENAKVILPPDEAAAMSRLAHHVGDDLQRMMARFKPSSGGRSEPQTGE